MAVPQSGDVLCPTGAVVLDGRRGVLNRQAARCTWSGKGHCSWCDKPVPKGRRTLWCSQWCVDAFSSTQPDQQRQAVLDRDEGRCALCGVDTDRLRRVARQYAYARAGDRKYGRRYLPPAICERLADLLTHLGRPVDHRVLRHLLFERVVWWDMDHTVPIADGGHPFDLRNLRTLCYWCHKDETAMASTRRAERRRGLRDQGDQVAMFDKGAKVG